MGIDGIQIEKKRPGRAAALRAIPQNEAEERSLALAIGLNFVLPGAGYMYMGKWFLCVLAGAVFFGAYFAVGLFFMAQAWLGLCLLMTVDMIILFNKRKKQIIESTTIKCPQCAELIKSEALVCRFCGNKIR